MNEKRDESWKTACDDDGVRVDTGYLIDLYFAAIYYGVSPCVR